MRDIESEILRFRKFIAHHIPEFPGIEFMTVENRNEVLCVWRKNIIKTTSILYNSYLFGKLTEEEFYNQFDAIQSLFITKN